VAAKQSIPAPRVQLDHGRPEPFERVIFPEKEYDVDPVWAFSIQFVTQRTVRIRAKTGLMCQASLAALRKPGVGAIKVDSGEAAPFIGI
jgi:hypothetical protein